MVSVLRRLIVCLAAAAGLHALQLQDMEFVSPLEGKRFSAESISVPLVQYGLYTTLSDKVQVHAIGQLQQKLTAEVGDSLGRTYDKVARAALLQSDNVVLADAFVKSTGVFANTNSLRSSLSTADANMAKMDA